MTPVIVAFETVAFEIANQEILVPLNVFFWLYLHLHGAIVVVPSISSLFTPERRSRVFRRGQ